MDRRATQPVSAAPPPQPVVDIGGFEVLARLGEGGMGQVFKARQKSIDRLVALKVLTPKLAQDRDYVERFEREAKAAGKLTHPNIVGVIDRGEQTNGPAPVRWIAFEFVDGSSLESKLKHGRLSEREALKVVRDMAEALAYAAKQGLIHRDVKPDNILLTSDGTPKLADLGLAKSLKDDASLTQTGIVMGTPHYMAPEQALGEKDLDIRADIYALGLVFYRCLTGEIPFVGDTALAILTRHINQDCPDPRVAVPTVSEGSVQLLRGMTARDKSVRLKPDEVVQSANALLAKLASGSSTGVPTMQFAAPGSDTGGSVAPTVAPARAAATTAAVAAKKTSGARRPPSGAGMVATGTKAPSAPRVPAKPAARVDDEEAESRLPLVIVGGLCLFLVVAGVWVVRHGGKSAGAPDVVAPNGSGAPTGSGPVVAAVPSDETKPEETVEPPREPAKDEPTHVELPKPVAPPPVGTDGLTKEARAELAKHLRDACARALDDPDRCAQLLEGWKGECPAGDPAPAVALEVAKQVDAVARELRDAPFAHDRLDKLAKIAGDAPQSALEYFARAEARSWHDVLDAIRTLHGFLAGNGSVKRPSAEGGALDALGDVWKRGVADSLESSLKAWDRAKWGDAREKAEKAAAILDGTRGFERVVASARAVAHLAALLERGGTPLDAREKLKDDPKSVLFLHRFGSVDATDANPKVPSGTFWNVEQKKGEGFLLAGAPMGPIRRDSFSLAALKNAWIGSGDQFFQLRFMLAFEKDSLELIMLRHPMNPAALLIAPGKAKRVASESMKEFHRDYEAALGGVRYEGGPKTVVEDLVYEHDGDGYELKLVLDGKPFDSTLKIARGLKLDTPQIHGQHVVIKKVEWLIRH